MSQRPPLSRKPGILARIGGFREDRHGVRVDDHYFHGDPPVVPRFQALHPGALGVPSIVVYELRYGLLCLSKDAMQPRLAALEALLEPMRRLPFDRQCAEQAARIRVELELELELAGIPIGPHDILIAATALRHQAEPVTRNVREFARVPGLRLRNWHEG